MDNQMEKPKRLTVPMHIGICEELKKLIDQEAYDHGLPTNEFVAQVMAARYGKPELGVIPRKPYGRLRKGVVTAHASSQPA